MRSDRFGLYERLSHSFTLKWQMTLLHRRLASDATDGKGDRQRCDYRGPSRRGEGKKQTKGLRENVRYTSACKVIKVAPRLLAASKRVK